MIISFSWMRKLNPEKSEHWPKATQQSGDFNQCLADHQSMLRPWSSQFYFVSLPFISSKPLRPQS